MDSQPKVIILEKDQMNFKIKRLAWQIYEVHSKEEEIYLCGITHRGYQLALLIADALKEISPIKVSTSEIMLDKDNPSVDQIFLKPDLKVKDKSVIIVDDVLYTGRTIAFACIPFLTHGVKQLQFLVLVNRNHLKFPVQAQFIGLTLATTVQENIQVDFESGQVVLF